MPETDLISGEELKEKLERGEDFKLVIALGEWEYKAKHIPAHYASARWRKR
jgi:hypothetical protein